MQPNPRPRDAFELFQSHFDPLLNPAHERIQLARKIDWARLESAYAAQYSADMGAPAKATRLMVGLHCLKYTFNESDESVVARWVENPYWQSFCGYTHMQHRCPIHPTSMTRWRKRVGADRIRQQQPHDTHKLYRLHEPDVQRISKGKAHKRYEFGQNVAIATTHRGNWMVAARLLPGNPYDGHTLAQTLTAVEHITGVPVTDAYVDKGYRGHGVSEPTNVHVAGQRSDPSRSERKRKRRRSAVEPKIGHLKSDHRMDRCFLAGLQGDAINAMLAAAGSNLRKLLRRLAAALIRWLESLAATCRPTRGPYVCD